MLQRNPKISAQKELNNITCAMNNLSLELAPKTARVNQLGEAGVGAAYMAEYNSMIQLWDEAKAFRDKLKAEIQNEAALGRNTQPGA